jgi:hypothetical protein
MPRRVHRLPSDSNRPPHESCRPPCWSRKAPPCTILLPSSSVALPASLHRSRTSVDCVPRPTDFGYYIGVRLAARDITSASSKCTNKPTHLLPEGHGTSGSGVPAAFLKSAQNGNVLPTTARRLPIPRAGDEPPSERPSHPVAASRFQAQARPRTTRRWSWRIHWSRKPASKDRRSS